MELLEKRGELGVAGKIVIALAFLLSPLACQPHAAERQSEGAAPPESVVVEIINTSERSGMSYADAAAAALASQDARASLHYRNITDKAIAAG